jgi:competence protein ComEC
MLARTLAFISGIYCLMQFSYLPSLWLLVLLPVCILLARFYSLFQYPLFFCLGFCWALFFAQLKMQNQLEPNIENTDIYIKGTIISISEVNNDHVRFLVDIKEINNLEGESFPSPGVARLSWYKNNVIPEPGETWQLKVKLKRPYGFMNSGGFDYEAWILRQGIKATGYVKVEEQNKKIADDGYYLIEKIRYKIARKLEKNLDKPLLGLVLALTLGDRSQLEQEQREILNKTGTSHLIAISGLHLSLVAGFVYFLMSFVWSRFYILTQRIPAPAFASVMAFFAALIYALLAGFTLPTQRALIMIAVFLLALFQPKQILISHVLCVAALLVLVIDPFAVITVDFYLSFMAVALILYLTRFRLNQFNNLTRWFYLQCLLCLALCPLLIFWFKQIPLYSVLANTFAIPLVGFLIVPLSLLALILLFTFPFAAQFLYGIIDKINNVCWSWLEFLSQQNNAVIPVAAPNIFTLLLAVIGILILTMPRGLPSRYLAFFFFIPLLFPLSNKLKSGEYEFVLLDVGQGLSAVIHTKEHTLVYDTGAEFSDRFNIGDAVLKPYLREKGVNNISTLIVSHGDNDHIGGSQAVIQNFSINHVLSSVPEKISHPNSRKCEAGQQWQWDGVSFEILHPVKESVLTGNNASCVLKVSSEFGAVLLTGDIEKEAERKINEQYQHKLDADILLVPHHGSKTSSTDRFITKVSPKYAFISAGYSNRFGFPKQDIMDRYNALGVETLVSYETGELSARFQANGLQITEFRTKNRHFWHH